jgi:hypothetical protein
MHDAISRRALALALATPALLLPAAARASQGFSRTAIRLERNLADGDLELVIEATGDDKGMASLLVTTPDGRAVVDFKAPDSRFGMRKFAFESPEPKDDGRLKAEFPEGSYRFTGSSTEGTRLEGAATLSHAFPPAPTFTSPREGASNVNPGSARIAWRPVPGLAGFLLVIEQEQSGRELHADLPGSATSFALAAGYLQPATEYHLLLASIAADGNRTVIESEFTTLGRS